MDIQYFITFREVARCLSLTRAAERLGFAQPTVTVQIQKLEKHFGVKLLERSGKTLQLTAGGAQLLPYADRLADSFLAAQETFAQTSDEQMRIGTIESLAAFFLPPYLQALRNTCPDINVTLLPSKTASVIDSVKNREYDIGIILDVPFTDPELETIPIRREELMLVCPAGHPLLAGPTVDATDLRNHDLVLTERTCAYRSALERVLVDSGVAYRVVSELGSLEAIKQCVLYGLGAALMPAIAVSAELHSGELHGVQLKEGVLPDFYTQVIVLRNKRRSRAVKQLLSLLAGDGPKT